MANLKSQCWDSVVLLSFLTRKIAARRATVSELINMFEEKRIDVVISTALITELRTYMDDDQGLTKKGTKAPAKPLAYNAADLAVIDALLANDLLDIRPLTPRLAETAAKIGNENPQLLPMDCIHIATAVEAKCDVLLTWDGAKDGVNKRRRPKHMLYHDGKFGNPALSILEPETVLLRMNAARQQTLGLEERQP